MTTGVYKIVHIESGKCYIGRSIDIETRWVAHRSLLNRGRHYNRRLQEEWSRHGPEAFALEIMEVCDGHCLGGVERSIIRREKPEFNIFVGRMGGSKRLTGPRIYTAETKAKMSQAAKMRTDRKPAKQRRRPPEPLPTVDWPDTDREVPRYAVNRSSALKLSELIPEGLTQG